MEPAPETGNAVPVDDGMAELRARIQVLKDTASSSEDLAYSLQKLMSEKWRAGQVVDIDGELIPIQEVETSSHSQSSPLSTGATAVPVPVAERPSTATSSFSFLFPSRPFFSHLSASVPKSVGKGTNVDSADTPAIGSLPSPTSLFGSPFDRAGKVEPKEEQAGDEYNVTAADLLPSFVPTNRRTSSEDGIDPFPEDAADSEVEEEERRLGCEHYIRNVKVQCVTCRKWYPCRHCHNEANPSHQLPRTETKYMICMFCQTPQAASGSCKSCGAIAARYYCDTCKLWDNDPENRVYHCADCGICRRGEGLGKDLVHCKNCSVCILIQHYPTHRCLPKATDRDCPICFQYMFTSSDSIVAMPCGHYLHQKCYSEYMKHEYRCPICKRSAVNMELEWRKLDEAIERQPMPDEYESSESEAMPESEDPSLSGDTPPELHRQLPGERVPSAEETPGDGAPPARYVLPTSSSAVGRSGSGANVPKRVTVMCNDCGSRSEVSFHWLGFKCAVCDSYNTDETSSTTIPSTRTAPVRERLVSSMLQVDPGRRPAEAATRSAGLAEPGGVPSEPWRPMSYLLNWTSRRSSNSISNAVNTAGVRTRPESALEPTPEQPADVVSGPMGPLELVQRVVGRSFSPIRNYLAEARLNAAEVAVEDVDGDWDGAEFWGRGGWFLSGDENAVDEEEYSESESSVDLDLCRTQDDDDDDGDYETGGRLAGLDLLGHP